MALPKCVLAVVKQHSTAKNPPVEQPRGVRKRGGQPKRAKGSANTHGKTGAKDISRIQYGFQATFTPTTISKSFKERGGIPSDLRHTFSFLRTLQARKRFPKIIIPSWRRASLRAICLSGRSL